MLAAKIFILMSLSVPVSPTEDTGPFKYLYPEDSKWKIAQCELGMRSSKVVALLGMPTKKSGMLATEKEASATFRIKDKKGLPKTLHFEFESGRVTEIYGQDDFGGTTLPSIGATEASVSTLLGEHESNIVDEISIFTYHTRLIQIFFTKGKVTGFALDIKSRARYWQLEEMLSSPSFRLFYHEIVSVSAFEKGKPDKIDYVTTTGIVENRRDERTKVRIRIVFRDKNGKFVGAGETDVTLNAGESKVFKLKTFDVFGDARTNKYEVQLSAVEE